MQKQKACAYCGRCVLRSFIAKYLDNPSNYYYALRQLKKLYSKPEVVVRSHLMALMNLLSIQNDNSHALAKLFMFLCMEPAVTDNIWNPEYL